MSTWPKAASPRCAIEVISFGLVTSSFKVWMWSGYCRARRDNFETSRAVAITRSPRFSASSARTYPKPVEVPVINQTRENVDSSIHYLAHAKSVPYARLQIPHLQGGIDPPSSINVLSPTLQSAFRH